MSSFPEMILARYYVAHLGSQGTLHQVTQSHSSYERRQPRILSSFLGSLVCENVHDRSFVLSIWRLCRFVAGFDLLVVNLVCVGIRSTLKVGLLINQTHIVKVERIPLSLQVARCLNVPTNRGATRENFDDARTTRPQDFQDQQSSS